MDAHEAINEIYLQWQQVKLIMCYLKKMNEAGKFYGEVNRRQDVTMLCVAERKTDNDGEIDLCFNDSGIALLAANDASHEKYTYVEFTEENLVPFGPNYEALIQEIKKRLLIAIAGLIKSQNEIVTEASQAALEISTSLK